MELHFEEIDKVKNNNLDNKKVSFNENNTYNTYWDPKPEYEKPVQTKKNISYDEILNSMNMVLVNGRLHFIPSNKFKSSSQNQNQNQNIQQKKQNNDNSYIYNKYFKNFKDQEHIEDDTPQVPLTPEEIKRNIIIHKIKQIQERKRIEQIKSRKLLFDTSNIHISQQANVSPPNLNKLFRFSNR
jgi:hypothetical protein